MNKSSQQIPAVRTPKSLLVGKPSISNNGDPVKPFFKQTSPFTPQSGLVRSVDFLLDDHGSLVISRSASVRPNHLFDHYFDHDYFFKLPLQGAGCPIMWTVCYFPPWTVPSCPAYEPHLPDCEYSQPFRHIQYN